MHTPTGGKLMDEIDKNLVELLMNGRSAPWRLGPEPGLRGCRLSSARENEVPVHCRAQHRRPADMPHPPFVRRASSTNRAPPTASPCTVDSSAE